MALIPGSYARAAGLQSEINKVTVTRVAGSEVQFRRAIDTYKRDLRYHVNHIQREQKQLRRSMRKYCKKLRESKKEREQRKAQLQVKATKTKEQQKHVQDSIVIHFPEIVSEGHDKAGDVPAKPSDAKPTGGSGGEGSTETIPDSPDSGIGVEADGDLISGTIVDGSPGVPKRNASKAFLTSTKFKPYFKAKRGQKDQPGLSRQKGQHGQPENGDMLGLENENGHDQPLPSIAEELEDDHDRLKDSSARLTFDDPAEPQEPFLEDRAAAGAENSDNKGPLEPGKTASKAKGAAQPVSVISINTKPAPKQGDVGAQRTGGVPAEGDGSSRREAGVAMTIARRTQRRKTGVSFGDLIKLQHTTTSSTKQLFSLVDRMASKHGIVDPPPENIVSKSTSLDPRTNIKIKRRGDGPQSKMSDGMVKHAAVLYSMKYGYNVPDLVQSTTAHLVHEDWEHVKGREEGGVGVDGGGYESERTDGTDLAAVRRNSRVDGADTVASRRNSTTLSMRLDSTDDVISTSYAFSDVESSAATEDIFLPAQLTDKTDTRTSRSRGRQRHKLSMPELSEHVSKIRSQMAERRDSNPVGLHPDLLRSQSPSRLNNSVPAQIDSTTALQPPEQQSRQRLSPLPQRSRSRRESVSSQIQERLNDQGDKGVAWQSAFGRLKMLHTLVDLAPYFHKD
nr:hypothetical protein BaRGS_004074 [Batillaria attramentaria]